MNLMTSTPPAQDGLKPATASHYRSLFPLVNRCVYLNSNATGATPRSAKLVLDAYWRTIEHSRDEVWPQWLDDLRQTRR